MTEKKFKPKSFPLYFGKRDEDLWNAIHEIGSGDMNHEIKKVLRAHFLGDTQELPTPPRNTVPQEKVPLPEEKAVGVDQETRAAIDSLSLNMGRLIK